MSESRPRQESVKTVSIPIAEHELLKSLADANKQERALARLTHDKDVALKRQETDQLDAKLDHKRTRMVVTSVNLVVLAVVVGVFFIVRWIHLDDHRKQVEIQRQHEVTVQLCVQRGNIWINGSCILGRS